MTKLFVSDAILEERLVVTPPNSTVELWGWKKLSALYQESFAACGLQITPVMRPEIYHTEIARRALGAEPGDWHLAVKPLEHLRPFHSLPNVFVCNWPFPELSKAPRGESPFYDQARLLRVADAVLCCTEFTTQTLQQAGVTRALTLPPVIPPTHKHGKVITQPGPKRFLSVIEHGHLDRQLVSLVEGFGAAARHTDLRLSICLQGGDADSPSDLERRIARCWPTPAPALKECVSVIAMPRGTGAMLYATADFFLCTHAAPGLFLPLAEAMLAGLPLVTTMTAGTASLLPREAVIPIATESRALPEEDEPIARYMPLTANPPTVDAVRDAILAAAMLDDAARSGLAKASRECAEARFSPAAFQSGIRQLGSFVSLGTA